MSDTNKTSGLQPRSLISKEGQLELSLAKVDEPRARPRAQVVVKIEATPINPSDLGLLHRPGRSPARPRRAAAARASR